MRPLLAVALVLLLPAGAQAQERLVAHLDAATPVAAYQDVVAWSQRDPATGRFALVTNRGPVGVPTRAVPFDVDLGPGTTEEVVAVYSRCRREAGGLTVGGLLVDRWRGCDLYRATLDGRERRIARASSPAADETWPSIWKGRVAFARRYDARRAYPYLYVNAGGRSRRVPGGPRRGCGDGGCGDPRRSQPLGVELYGRRLGFAWRYAGVEETAAYELRVHDVDGRARTVVDRFAGGGLTGIAPTWPGFQGGSVFWQRSCFGDPSGCAGGRDGLFASRYTAPARRRRDFPAGTGVALAHDRAGATTYVLVDRTLVGDCRGDPPAPGGTCDLLALTG